MPPLLYRILGGKSFHTTTILTPRSSRNRPTNERRGSGHPKPNQTTYIRLLYQTLGHRQTTNACLGNVSAPESLGDTPLDRLQGGEICTCLRVSPNGDRRPMLCSASPAYSCNDTRLTPVAGDIHPSTGPNRVSWERVRSGKPSGHTS